MPFARFASFVRVTALTVLLTFLLRPAAASADASVTGSVTDQLTHQPIAGAVVAAVGAPAHATTDEAGRFTFATSQPVKAVVVSRIGYARLQVAVPADGSALAIELVPAAVQLQGLELTGRAIARSQLDVPSSTGTLTGQDLRRADGLALENSVNTLPGVLMQSRTPWGGAHVMIRGYYPNFSQNSNGYGVETYLNDIPVTDASGLTVMDDVDYASLGSLEVIKGPASSLYGSQIAGTVLMHSTMPRAGETGLEQSNTGGSDGLFRTSTTYRTASEFSSMVLSYGHQTYDSFRPNSGSRKNYANFEGQFHAGPKQTLSTYFAYANSYEQLSGEIDSTDFYARHAIDNPVYAANRSFIKIESNRIGITDDYAFADRIANKATFFVTTQTFQQPFAHGFSDANRFNYGVRNTASYGTRAGAVDLNGVLGGQFQRTNYTNNGYTIPASSPTDQENYAFNYYGFTEWTATAPSQVSFTLGGAVNANEFGIRNLLVSKIVATPEAAVHRRAFPAVFTPRASLLKTFSDQVSVYGSASTGYTPPSLTTIIASDNSINWNLKPEKAVQYELGSKGRVLNRKLSFDLALFDLEVSDKLVSQKVGTVSFTTNAGKQRNQGAELTVSALVIDDPSRPVSLLRPWFSCTYSNFKYVDFKSDNNNNAATVSYDGKQVARTPKNMLNIGLDAASRSGLYLYGSYQYVDKAFVTFTNSNWVKSYSLLNAKLGWQRKLDRHWDLDVSAGGDNLLGSTYYTFLFVGPTYAGLAQAKDGGTGDGYIIPGDYNASFFGGARLSYGF